MIRIEYDDKSNPNYVMTRWIEETETSSAMLGRLYLPLDIFRMLTLAYFAKEFLKFEEKVPK